MVLEGWDWRGDSAPSYGEQTGGIMAFTPAESKRLIAKAVVAMPQVRAALEKGRVIVGAGTSDAYVAEEILGKPVPREFYTKGIIAHGLLCSTKRSDRWIKPYVFVDGAPVDVDVNDALKDFDARDVFIKGANAIDPEGNAGVLLGGLTGGTIGGSLGHLMGRGSHLIMPVGLEKLIPSVIAATRKCGVRRLKYPDGATVGFMPVVGATVVTEVEALRILAGVQATHVASGGVGGSEGSVVLVVEGPDERVREAFELWESIKGEQQIQISPIALRYGIDGRTGTGAAGQ